MGLNKRLISSEAAAGGGGDTDFSVITYSGTSAEQSFNIGFEPDIIWMMGRNTAGRNYFVYDNSGADTDFKYLSPSSSNAEEVASGVSTSDTGFTLQSSFGWNYTGITYVAWCWKAASSYSSNSDGTVTSTVGANIDAGFSIAKYAGQGTPGTTFGHGLDSAPELVIIKTRSNASDWLVHTAPLGNNTNLVFNGADSLYTNSDYIRSTNSTTVTLGGSTIINRSGRSYVAFSFHSVAGKQKISTYTGSGSNKSINGLGFQPRFLMIKRTDGSGNWVIIDSERSDNELYANLTNAESYEPNIPTLESDGFNLIGSRYNNSGGTFIYLAIA